MSARLPPDQPERLALYEEIHARPPEAMTPPLRLSYLVLMSGADREPETAAFRDLLARFGKRPPAGAANHYSADLGPFRLKFERHTEFVRYTFIAKGAPSATFAKPAIALVPAQWLKALPGETMAATHAILLRKPKPDQNLEALAKTHFGGNVMIGARLSGNAGSGYTDARVHEDGFGRLVVHDHGMTPRQTGRMVQRLLEIDTYRIFALLGLPAARALAPALDAYERELAAVAGHMPVAGEEDEPMLLDRLTRLAAAIESRSSETRYRFGATAAYHDLVERRLEELREERIEGLQTFSEFNERRFAPAMATCGSIAARQMALRDGVARATQLLSTRVDISRERQNQALLNSMDSRGRTQLRLQQTVEGLSIAAITYYIVGLAGYAAKGAKAAGWNVEPDIVMALSIPVVAALVFWGLRRFRRTLGE